MPLNSTISSIFLSFINLTFTNFLSRAVQREIKQDASFLCLSISHSSMHSEFGTCGSTAPEICVGSALCQKKPGITQLSSPAPIPYCHSSRFVGLSAPSLYRQKSSNPWKQSCRLPPSQYSDTGMSAGQQDTQTMCSYHKTRGRPLPVSQIQEGRGAKLVLQLSSTEMCLGPGDFLMDAWEQHLQAA